MVKPKEFYAENYADALAFCEAGGMRGLYMPEVAQARIDGFAPWNRFYDSLSLRVTGKRKGEPFVLYVHTEHPLTTADGVRTAMKEGFVNGALRFPQDAFEQLLEHDGEKYPDGTYLVKMVGYDKLKKSLSGMIFVDDALEHPQTVPFLGSEERAEHYLKAFRNVHGQNIGVWHCDDLHDSGPLVRPLVVGCSYYFGLIGVNGYFNYARLFGVPRATASAGAEGVAHEARQKISGEPTLDEAVESMFGYVHGLRHTDSITREGLKETLVPYFPRK